MIYILLSARCVCKSVGWGLPHRAGTPGFNGGASPTLHSLQPIGAHIVEPPPQLSRTSRELFQSPTGGEGAERCGFRHGFPDCGAVLLRQIVKPSATPVQNTLHKVFSTANICAGGCSMPTPLSQYIHQNTAQYPDVSGNIPVAGRWCSRSSRVATADTAAESIFLPPAPPPPPRAAAPLRRRFLPRWRSLCLPLFTQSGSLKRPA